MARVATAMITFNDAVDMVNIEGYRFASPISGTNECMTKSDIENALICKISGTFASNELVPYDNIARALSISVGSPYGVGDGTSQFTFDLFFDGAFTITDNAGWITVSPTSGTGETTITVSYQSNGNTSSRTGTITITDTATGDTLDLVVDQAGNTGTAVTTVQLGSGASYSAACDAYNDFLPQNFYIPDGETWATATDLFSNSSGTTNASAGYYSDGNQSRYWNGSSFGGSNPCS